MKAGIYVRAAAVLFSLIIFSTSCDFDPESSRMSGRDFPDFPNELFIINNLAETISVLDTDTGILYNDAVTTGVSPNDIHYYSDRLYVVNSGSNSITVYDESTLNIIGDIYLGKGRNPWSIVSAAGSPKAYVANFLTGTVSVINLDTLEVTGEIEGIGSGPEDGCYAAGKVYICVTGYEDNAFGEGSVAVIDTLTDEITARIPAGIGTNPQSAVAVPGTENVHIVLTGSYSANDGGIMIISTATDSIVSLSGEAETVGGSPLVSPGALDEESGRVYLGGSGGITVYDYSTLEILHSIEEPFYGTMNMMNIYPAIYIHERFLYAADFNNDSVIAVDIQSGEAEKYNGSDGPQDIVHVSE